MPFEEAQESIDQVMAKAEWPTPAEMRVMQTLQDNPAGLYGLEIVEKSEGGVKRGSVYVFLGQLEEKGFVRVLPTKKAPQSGGLPRPKYQLTAEGTRVMQWAGSLGIATARA